MPPTQGRSLRVRGRAGPTDALMSQMMHDTFSHERGILSLVGGMAGGAVSLDRMMGNYIMGGGAVGGSIGACSTSCYSSYSSRDGGSVSFSSTSHGVHAPGQVPVIETQRTYRDSSGAEKIGIWRTVGHRGRNLVAERNADGSEKRTHQLLNVEDGTEFDELWRRHPGAAAIGRSRAAATPVAAARPLTAGAHGPLADRQSASDFGGGRGPTVHQSARDRAAAHAGRVAYEKQRDRMIEEARRQRHASSGSETSRSLRRPTGDMMIAADDRRLGAGDARRVGRS